MEKAVFTGIRSLPRSMAPLLQVLAHYRYLKTRGGISHRKQFVICKSFQNVLNMCETGRVDNVYGDRNLVCTLQPANEEQAAAAVSA